MTTERHQSSATVADEAGKGIESLRQQLLHFDQGAGLHGDYVLMYVEVDSLIRAVKVLTGSTDPTGGTVQLWRIRGGSTSNFTGIQAISGMGAYDELDVPLTQSIDFLRKGDRVGVTVSGIAPDSVNLSVALFWMPDLFGLDAQPRTY